MPTALAALLIAAGAVLILTGLTRAIGELDLGHALAGAIVATAGFILVLLGILHL